MAYCDDCGLSSCYQRGGRGCKAWGPSLVLTPSESCWIIENSQKVSYYWRPWQWLGGIAENEWIEVVW